MVAEKDRACVHGDCPGTLKACKVPEPIWPESPELAYNHGAAPYELGGYVRAREGHGQRLLTRVSGLDTGARFDLGDAALLWRGEGCPILRQTAENAEVSRLHEVMIQTSTFLRKHTVRRARPGSRQPERSVAGGNSSIPSL